MSYHFRNLVFEGGGVKGIAYVGALEVMEERGIPDGIQRIGGASAGAINAILMGLGYDLEETRELLWELDFNRFMDDSWGVIRDTSRLLHQFGWYRGDFFRGWIAERIAVKTGNGESTFADLKRGGGFRDLFFIGTNISTGYAEVFSHEHTPGMAVADAVRISMSIPLFFVARRNLRNDLFVDGGMLDNYPIKLFDRRRYVEAHCLDDRGYYVEHNAASELVEGNPAEMVFNQETLGFRLDSAREIDVFRGQSEPPRHDVDDFFDYARALVRTLLNAQQSQHLHSDDWHRTVYIDSLGVGTTEFDLSDAQKEALVESGRQHTLAYFEWFDEADDAWNAPA